MPGCGACECRETRPAVSDTPRGDRADRIRNMGPRRWPAPMARAAKTPASLVRLSGAMPRGADAGRRGPGRAEASDMPTHRAAPAAAPAQRVRHAPAAAPAGGSVPHDKRRIPAPRPSCASGGLSARVSTLRSPAAAATRQTVRRDERDARPTRPVSAMRWLGPVPVTRRLVTSCGEGREPAASRALCPAAQGPFEAAGQRTRRGRSE